MTPSNPAPVGDEREQGIPCDLLAGLVAIWDKKAGGRAGSPNHGHAVPGIWDSDNGELAGKPCAECALYDRARALSSSTVQQVGAPEGFVLAPAYRGYAYLGTGQYVLNNSGDGGEDPELIISIASEEEKAGRTIGDSRDNPEGHMIQPELMCVRLRFANVAGLDALEKQLRMLREECFPSSPKSDGGEGA